jgi:hypothetical protein
MGHRYDYEEDQSNCPEHATQNYGPEFIDRLPSFFMALLNDQKPINKGALWSCIANRHIGIILIVGR